MNENLSKVSKIFESKIRIQMIASLSISELTYKQLKQICQCTDGNMTTHTKKLIESKFITVKKEFINNKPQTTYHLTDLGKKCFIQYVDTLNELVKETKN